MSPTLYRLLFLTLCPYVWNCFAHCPHAWKKKRNVNGPGRERGAGDLAIDWQRHEANRKKVRRRGRETQTAATTKKKKERTNPISVWQCVRGRLTQILAKSMPHLTKLYANIVQTNRFSIFAFIWIMDYIIMNSTYNYMHWCKSQRDNDNNNSNKIKSTVCSLYARRSDDEYLNVRSSDSHSIHFECIFTFAFNSYRSPFTRYVTERVYSVPVLGPHNTRKDLYSGRVRPTYSGYFTILFGLNRCIVCWCMCTYIPIHMVLSSSSSLLLLSTPSVFNTSRRKGGSTAAST